MKNWRAPQHWQRISTIDAHTAGEPFRVVTSGFPELPGDTILARRRFVKEHHDRLRTALMLEPRGHADMYGCLVTPPVSPGADFGVLFMHNEGFSTMCGHGIIAMTTVALETGLVAKQAPQTTLRIDTPAGLVVATGHVRDGRVASVSFRNVPSFVLGLDQVVSVPGLGNVRYDLAFGGAFSAYVRAEDVGLKVSPEDLHPLIDKGMAVKRAIMASRPIPHPTEEDLSFLYGTIFIDRPRGAGAIPATSAFLPKVKWTAARPGPGSAADWRFTTPAGKSGSPSRSSLKVLSAALSGAPSPQSRPSAPTRQSSRRWRAAPTSPAGMNS